MLLLLVPLHSSRADDVVVFAEETLRPVVEAIGAAWRRETGVPVHMFAAPNSGLMVEQLARGGARCDILITLGTEAMDDAQRRQLIRPETRFDLAQNKIVLAAADAGQPPTRIATAADLDRVVGADRIAIADPGIDAAGAYAARILDGLAVSPELRGRLVGAAGGPAVLEALDQGRARLGIVYASDATGHAPLAVTGTFEASLVPPITHPVARSTRPNPDAERFMDFLRSAPARQLLEEGGLAPAH